MAAPKLESGFAKLHLYQDRAQRVLGSKNANVELGFTASGDPNYVDWNGQRLLMAGSNNYHGMSFDRRCMRAAKRAIDEQGTGATGSRLANGTLTLHKRLEEALAQRFAKKSAIVFTTGYQANLGALSGMLQADSVVVLDTDCHASIYDGCILGGAQIVRFRHNSIESLEKHLKRARSMKAPLWVCLEGIYSMLGDRAPLAEIVSLKRKYRFRIFLDEAHSFGLLGRNGCGLAEELNLLDEVDLIAGTFSKSLGATGGYCVFNNPVFEALRFSARAYAFTAAPAPASAAAALEALRLLPEVLAERRKDFGALIGRFRSKLRRLGFTVPGRDTPIVPILFARERDAVACWRRLLELGVYVNLAVPPASPRGISLLRCSLSSLFGHREIEILEAAFASVCHEAAVAG